MILKKVSAPVGIDGRMYWDLMLLSMTNEKFCSLRSNFKQEIFEKFQGEAWVECELLLSPTTNDCTHMFGLNVLDDTKNSWVAPGDYTGKLFVKIRELNNNPQDTSDLTYDDTEYFLVFLDKYASQAVGNHTFAKWKNCIKPRLSWIKSWHWTLPTHFWKQQGGVGKGVAHQGLCKNGQGKEECRTTS